MNKLTLTLSTEEFAALMTAIDMRDKYLTQRIKDGDFFKPDLCDWSAALSSLKVKVLLAKKAHNNMEAV